jgi:GNAT superfamily N-acetyltransferase
LIVSSVPPPASDGKLTVTITYLEMTGAPKRAPRPAPPRKLALLRTDKIPIHFYRYLYNTVGERWLWYERRVMSDESLAVVVQDPAVDIYVLYLEGAPVGYAELDRRAQKTEENEIEIAFFGLMPEVIGQGLGGYLLDWTIDTAWSRRPRRLWINTCNLDHPRALQTYQKAGFVPYKQITKVIDDPRVTGIIPMKP